MPASATWDSSLSHQAAGGHGTTLDPWGASSVMTQGTVLDPWGAPAQSTAVAGRSTADHPIYDNAPRPADTDPWSPTSSYPPGMDQYS